MRNLPFVFSPKSKDTEIISALASLASSQSTYGPPNTLDRLHIEKRRDYDALNIQCFMKNDGPNLADTSGAKSQANVPLYKLNLRLEDHHGDLPKVMRDNEDIRQVFDALCGSLSPHARSQLRTLDLLLDFPVPDDPVYLPSFANLHHIRTLRINHLSLRMLLDILAGEAQAQTDNLGIIPHSYASYAIFPTLHTIKVIDTDRESDSPAGLTGKDLKGVLEWRKDHGLKVEKLVVSRRLSDVAEVWKPHVGLIQVDEIDDNSG